jgi:aldose 1-epimerase
LDAFQSSDDILNHHLFVDANKVIALDSNGIPTGEFIDVEGNAYDFRNIQALGARWNDTEGFSGEGASC